MPIHFCGSSWGIGSYKFLDDNKEEQIGYGFYRTENPNDFYPDKELCSEKELAAHESDKNTWNLLNPTKKE